MWSDTPETGDIRVNGFRFRAPKSAYIVLEDQGSMWTPRLLWIDSICINQKDKEEKVSQIQLMKNIYSNAFFVSVCLQPSPIASNEAADYIKAYQFPGFLGLSENDKKEVVKLSEPGMAADMIQELHWAFTKSSATELSMWIKYAGCSGQPRWLAFENLLRNNWFNRIWVVQEVALASSVHVFYSKTEIPWPHLINVMSMCSSHQSLICLIGATRNVGVRKLPPTGIFNAQIMADFRRKATESESRSTTFSNVLYNCDLFQATNARDTIFGTHGLCNVENGSLITLDYDKKSEVRVYIDAAVYLLSQETPLRLLSYVGIGNYLEPRKIADLPSWCPHWSRRPLFARLSYDNRKPDYQA
jgi:Heterokaryon incompatibility protein (HET)